LDRSTCQRIGVVAANAALSVGAVGVVAWILRRFGPTRWHEGLDAVIVVTLALAVAAWLVCLWARRALTK
jgi:hypothetical protein